MSASSPEINLDDLSNLKQTCYSERKGSGFLVLSTLRHRTGGPKGTCKDVEWVVVAGTRVGDGSAEGKDLWWEAVYTAGEAKAAMRIDGSAVPAHDMPSRIRTSFVDGELKLTIQITPSLAVYVDLEPCELPPLPFSFVTFGLEVTKDAVECARVKERLEKLRAELDQVRSELSKSKATIEQLHEEGRSALARSKDLSDSPKKRRMPPQAGGPVVRQRGVVPGMAVKDDGFCTDSD
ncbi:BQ5605_C010g06130 [Microbotryum silenes-dioicae]|uniref:BQ5605_C010g06130 protein n=1 Tax=Microbotryum silenes-dioicae TaxID=796604 RepID=A0A2X0LQJ6_9BASI|nr:BQ5605_C010g06130 [Microbotryum silenes-dioicae]